MSWYKLSVLFDVTTEKRHTKDKQFLTIRIDEKIYYIISKMNNKRKSQKLFETIEQIDLDSLKTLVKNTVLFDEIHN